MEGSSVSLHDDVANWLERFAGHMRARDIEGGRAMFDRDVSAFGTRIDFAQGLDDLVARQWAPTWFSTSEFRFIDESLLVVASDDGSLVTALARWESLGGSVERGRSPRQGRCTILLRRDAARPGGFRAVHTHFSESPQA